MSSANVAALLSLVASVFFILALKGLRTRSAPAAATASASSACRWPSSSRWPLPANVNGPFWRWPIGGVLGGYVANRVEMTQMPELVAAMHSLVGLAAVLIAFAVVSNPLAFNIPFPIPRGNRVELFIGTFVGAMTFSGSVIAFGAREPGEDVPPLLQLPDRVHGPAHGESPAGDRDGRPRRRVRYWPRSDAHWPPFIG